VKLSPSLRLCGLGAIQLLALILCSHKFGGDGEAFPIVPLTVAGVAYLLALRELFYTPKFSKSVIVAGLVLAAAWHVVFLAIPTGSDDDVRRYVWDGRIQRLGYNPYVVVPDDPAVATLHTSETHGLNNPQLPSPYPPGAQLFFRAVTAIHESAFAFRVVLTLCDVAIVWILLAILRHTGQGVHWILAYAWNPLLATEVAGSGHIDILGALLLVISFAALLRHWRAVAAVTFALAVAVKFLPILLLPLYWRRIRVRDALLAAVIFVLLYLPFLDHGRIPVGSLGTYVHSYRFNSPLFSALEQVVRPEVVAGFAALLGLLIAVWFRNKSQTLSADAFAWSMAASLLSAPVVYPWYLLWLLPFTRSLGTLPIIIWTVSIIPTYIVWHLRILGRTWGLPGWVVLLEYGAVGLTGAIVVFCRIARRSTSQDASS
jgi:hypothetical protein